MATPQMPPLDVYIPPSFAYFVKRMSKGFSTSTVRMTVLSNTLATQGSTIKVKFPANAIVNMSSFTMYCKGYTKTTAGFAGFPKMSQSLINQLRVSIGGQVVSGGNLQEAGVLYNILSRMQQGEAQISSLGLQHLGRDISTPTANIAEADAIPIVIDDWGGFLSCTPSFIHTGIMPEIIVDIVLANTNVLSINDKAVAAGIEYFLKDIFFTIEVIQFDEDTYSKILYSRLEAGQTIEIPFPDSHYVYKPGSIIETQVSANAISKVFIVPRVSGFNVPDKPYYGVTKPFQFDINPSTRASNTTYSAVLKSSTCTGYWSVDNKMYPSTPATVPELYQMTIDAFGDRASTSSVNYLMIEPKFELAIPLNAAATNFKRFVVADTVNGQGSGTEAQLLPEIPSITYTTYYDAAELYLGRNAIFCLNLELNEGSNERLVSGYNSVGKNSVIRFDGSNLFGTVDLAMFVMVKRVLKVRAGGQIYLEM